MVKVIVLDVMSNDWGEIYSSFCEVAFFMPHPKNFPEKWQWSRHFSCSLVKCIQQIQHVDVFSLFNDSWLSRN